MSLTVQLNLDERIAHDAIPLEAKKLRATARYFYALADAMDGGAASVTALADAPLTAAALAPQEVKAEPAKRTRAAKDPSVPPVETKSEPAPEPEPVAEEEDLFGDSAPEAPKAVTAEDLKAAARKLMEAKGPESVRKLMLDLGLSKTQKLNDLPEAKWADFVAKANAA